MMKTKIFNDLRLLERMILTSYAHNSRLFAFFAEEASLYQIVEFIAWTAGQPPFVHFLERGLTRLPAALRPLVRAHIEEEQGEDHLGLWRRMQSELLREVNAPIGEPDHERQARRFYPISPEFADAEPYASFLGSFMASELLNQRRCTQLCLGLARLGSTANRRYLELHTTAESRHWVEVRRDLIAPALEDGWADLAGVQRGVRARLDASADYLRWYEARLSLDELDQAREAEAGQRSA